MRFATRTFLWSLIPFALLLAGSFWAVQNRVILKVREKLQSSVKQTQASLASMRAGTEQRDRRVLRVVSQNPALKAGVQLMLGDRARSAGAPEGRRPASGNRRRVGLRFSDGFRWRRSAARGRHASEGQASEPWTSPGSTRRAAAILRAPAALTRSPPCPSMRGARISVHSPWASGSISPPFPAGRSDAATARSSRPTRPACRGGGGIRLCEIAAKTASAKSSSTATPMCPRRCRANSTQGEAHGEPGGRLPGPQSAKLGCRYQSDSGDSPPRISVRGSWGRWRPQCW